MVEAVKPAPKTTFSSLLKDAGYSKAELAFILGVDASSVSRWGNEPPVYAQSYVNLLIEMKNLKRDLRVQLGKALLTLKNL